MNRQQRRALQRGARRGGGTILLEGGPMHGWVVTPAAPALHPSWGELAGYPGRYEDAGRNDSGVDVWRWAPAPGTSVPGVHDPQIDAQDAGSGDRSSDPSQAAAWLSHAGAEQP